MVLKHCNNIILMDGLDSPADTLLEIQEWQREMVRDATPQLLDLVEPSMGSEKVVGSPLNPVTGDPYEQLYSSISKLFT